MDGKTLFEARKTLGLSQDEMAAKIFVSRQTYNGYENGNSIPKTKFTIIKQVIEEAQNKENRIDQIMESSDSALIFTEFVEELKALRKDYRDLKGMFSEYIESSSKQSKINQLSISQLGILSEILKNVLHELDENKKTDLKKSVKAK